MKHLRPSPPGVKTAWTDPHHVRLTQPPPDERVNPPQTRRRKCIDPEDPWATPEDGETP